MNEDDFTLCVLNNTRIAARTVSRYYDRVARKVGMTAGQFSIMVVIQKFENETTAGIASLLSMERTTLVRNIALLESKGMVEPFQEVDGRSKHYRLTPAGERLLKEVLPLWREAQDAIKAELGDEEFFNTIAVLKRLSQI